MIKWFWDRYLFTITLVFWLLCLFTVVTLKVFGFIGDIPNIPSSTATTYGALFGIPAIMSIVKLRSKLNFSKDNSNAIRNNESSSGKQN